MPKISHELHLEFKRLEENASLRRKQLFDNGRKRVEQKKLITIISGVFALFSASSTTSALVLFVGNIGMQIFGAIAAAISGLVSLIILSFYNDMEISEMITGSSKYLDLREKAFNILLNPDITSKTAYKELTILKKEYTSLDMVYARYLPPARDSKQDNSREPREKRTSGIPIFIHNEPNSTNIGPSFDILERPKDISVSPINIGPSFDILERPKDISVSQTPPNFNISINDMPSQEPPNFNILNEEPSE